MKPDFEKGGGLVPAIVQDDVTGRVLMLGYMNEEALELTRTLGKVTFFSRTRSRIWTKGETSGNHLLVRDISLDCDGDTLLIKAVPTGPVCHTGAATCFDEPLTPAGLLGGLERVIDDRKRSPSADSHTSRLLAGGPKRAAQKFGEEAVELVLEAAGDDDDAFKAEAADTLFHFLVLLRAKDMSLSDILEVLAARRR